MNSKICTTYEHLTQFEQLPKNLAFGHVMVSTPHWWTVSCTIWISLILPQALVNLLADCYWHFSILIWVGTDLKVCTHKCFDSVVWIQAWTLVRTSMVAHLLTGTKIVV